MYRAEGNRTHRFIDANQNGQLDQGDTDITQYTWDHRNRLVKVEHRPGYAAAVDKVVEYFYDYQNRWVRKALDSDGDGHLDGRRIFIYDGSQIVMDFRRANSQDMQIGHLRERYLWGPAVDQILAEEGVDGGTADLVHWTLTDHLNTVRDIAKYDSQTDTTTVVNHFCCDTLVHLLYGARNYLVYDAFGRVTSESSPAVDSLFLFTARLFSAGLFHAERTHRKRCSSSPPGRLTPTPACPESTVESMQTDVDALEVRLNKARETETRRKQPRGLRHRGRHQHLRRFLLQGLRRLGNGGRERDQEWRSGLHLDA